MRRSLTAGALSALVLATATAGHAAPAKQVPLARLVGQTVMVRIDGTTASAALLGRVRRGEVGGVILFGDNIASLAQVRALVASLQAAAKAGGNPPLLISTDQEGGIVKRLPDGPPSLSAAELGERDDPALVRQQGAATGKYMRALGIDVDLAPVLDTVHVSDSFLGSRSFGSDPALVARVGPAFGTGLQTARVAATAKHFPGLGRAEENTDTAFVSVRATRASLLGDLAPFRAAVTAGTKLVMVSNAAYPALDPSGLPACLSPRIVGGLLRKSLGFHGVVITDAFETPGPERYRDASVRALKAGVDVLLFAESEQGSAARFASLLQVAKSGQLSRATLQQHYGRVLALKRWLD